MLETNSCRCTQISHTYSNSSSNHLAASVWHSSSITVVVFQSGFQDGSNPSSIVGTDLVLGLHFCTQQVSCVSVFVFRH